ncbi:MAG: hypothetical protein RPR97_03610, partial [Colwellia sp.]
SYNDVDSFVYSDLHDHIKNLKWGYGKVTDHVNREIRLKRLSREQGIELVNRYQDIAPKFNENFLKWLGVTTNSFAFLIDQHRNKNIWQRNSAWHWERIDTYRQPPVNLLEGSRLVSVCDNNYLITDNKKKYYQDYHYVLFSKGWLNDK